MSSTIFRDDKIRGRAEAAIFTDSCRYATAATLSSESGLPLNSMRSILATTSTNESGWHLSFVFALRLRFGCRRRIRLKQPGFLEVFFPSCDARPRAAAQMSEKTVTPGFVLSVILD